ncbi:hypothetical protein CBFG_02147 [Clostridiales bacterium 1_7_47FAA]|nr:hypothetical protein CBFG_02147 [Clostridiales bacterium 1_7_47FAA]
MQNSAKNTCKRRFDRGNRFFRRLPGGTEGAQEINGMYDRKGV